MTSFVGPDSRLRRTVRSVPVLGPLLQSAVDGYADLKDRRIPTARDTTAIAVGRSFSAGGRKLLLVPYRAERVDLPPPLVAGDHRFDVVQDLVEFTSLAPETVHALIARRIENFRTEWLQQPATLRDDHWFYLSSHTYLFANAVHFHDTPDVIEEISSLLSPGARVLDFGGGTGNLALALAARGFRIEYRELSALQRDFTRFRVQRHELQEHVSILDSWSALPAESYDAVCAFDVMEHLPDLPRTVEQIASALVEGGLFIDTPSFSVGIFNPMHHEDPGLESLLHKHGLVLDRTFPAFRVWAKRTR